MKKIIVCLVVTSLLAMINGGCSGKKKIEHKSTYTETIAGLAPETVLLEVNGRKATKRDLEAVRSFRQTFYKFMQKDVKDSDLEKVYKTEIETFSGNFIRETLIQEAIDSYLKEHGPFSTNQMATARKVVERQYEFARKNGRMRFAAIRKQMERDGVRDCFDRNVQVETLQEAFLANAFTNRYVIDSNTVARVYASVEEHNALVAATNKAIAAQMQDVARKLDNGESFESLADLY